MRVMKHAVLAASFVGGAMMLSGTGQASAATVAPALVQTGDAVTVHQVTHDGRSYYGGQRYGQRNYSRYGYSRDYRRSGPAIGFGLSVPGFSFGVGVPTRQYYGQPYGYGQPYRYGYGYRY